MYQIVLVCFFFLSDYSWCKMGVARSRYEHGLLLWVASADCLTKVFYLLFLKAHIKCCTSHELNLIILMSKIYCFYSLELGSNFDWGPSRVSSCSQACLLPRIIFYNSLVECHNKHTGTLKTLRKMTQCCYYHWSLS